MADEAAPPTEASKEEMPGYELLFAGGTDWNMVGQPSHITRMLRWHVRAAHRLSYSLTMHLQLGKSGGKQIKKDPKVWLRQPRDLPPPV